MSERSPTPKLHGIHVPVAPAAAGAPGPVARTFYPAALVEDEVIIPGGPAARPPFPRGRPRGAKTRVTHERLTADEFAVLRAVVQGVDIAVAARQYLLWPGRVPERKGLLRDYRALLRRIAAAASVLPDRKLARQMAANLLRYQRTAGAATAEPEGTTDMAAGPGSQKTVAQKSGVGDGRGGGGAAAFTPAVPSSSALSALPTLDEFAERFDEGMFSEAELLELYQEEFAEQLRAQSSAAAAPAAVQADSVRVPGRPRLSAAERISHALQAIEWLDRHLGARPERSHHVDQWVRLTLKQRVVLREIGVLTLGNLVDWMSLRGQQWYRTIPGLGQVRAQALWAWLQRWAIVPALGLARVDSPRQLPVPVTGMTPLLQLRWPVELDGARGKFRSPRDNALDADNDPQAVQAWFALIQDKSPATQTAYRRAIERLVLWAVHERGQALSSLSQADMLEFRAFLANPPPHWIQEPRAERLKDAPGWRPLRGPLNEQSLRLTFAAISAMYEHWRESDYTTINPARRVQARRDEATMDVARSFTKRDLQVMADTLHDMADGAERRRLRALLMLLEMSGLRREEVTTATWSDITQAVIDGQRTEDCVLKVLGKGRRVRNVPLNGQIIQALLEHRADRRELMLQGPLGRYAELNESALPLIGVLDERAPSSRSQELAIAQDQAPEAEPNGALSASSIYALLKRFWARCSVVAGEDPEDPHTTFKRASPHWLRHTCAHKLLRATDKDLPLVQAILGHKSITTTAIYVKADLAERIEAVKAVNSGF